jgi:hypothetical protein
MLHFLVLGRRLPENIKIFEKNVLDIRMNLWNIKTYCKREMVSVGMIQWVFFKNPLSYHIFTYDMFVFGYVIKEAGNKLK